MSALSAHSAVKGLMNHVVLSSDLLFSPHVIVLFTPGRFRFITDY